MILVKLPILWRWSSVLNERRAGRPRQLPQPVSICRTKYVNFTPDQKRYLRLVHDEYPHVGRYDIRNGRIDSIIEVLCSIGYDHQVINPLKVSTWFKNERQRRIRKLKKLKK